MRYLPHHLLVSHALCVAAAGGLGQLGRSLASVLRKTYGSDSVFLTDIKQAPSDVVAAGKCCAAVAVFFLFLCQVS